jgi:hypothetical protein
MNLVTAVIVGDAIDTATDDMEAVQVFEAHAKYFRPNDVDRTGRVSAFDLSLCSAEDRQALALCTNNHSPLELFESLDLDGSVQSLTTFALISNGCLKEAHAPTASTIRT